MKRLLITFFALLIACNAWTLTDLTPPFRSMADPANMGISTQTLLEEFAAYRELLGLKPYPTNLFDRELDAKTVNLQISDYCRIRITQADRMVVDFMALTDDVAQTEASREDIIMTFSGLMMVSNPGIDPDNCVELLTQMIVDRQDVTVGGITYHYSTSQPMTNIIAMKASLAKE